jgi:hypothetical protein
MKNQNLKSIDLINTKNKKNKLLVHGQGVYIFNYKEDSSYFYNFNDIMTDVIFTFYTNDKKDGLKVIFTKDNVNVIRLSDSKNLTDTNNNYGLTNKKGAYYWFSLDSQNQQLYAGIGESRIETKIYEYKFLFLSDDERKSNKQFLESLTYIKNNSKNITPIKLLRDPITMCVPLLIKNTDELSLDDIARGFYLPKANLSIISQKLYDCISGEMFYLNSDDFPDFSDAIEYSIITEGKWCNTRLKEKSREFNKDKSNILETYLRITLGQNNGESPGIPYVMEIWPIGHYSPIHNHGNSNAIIRVLHGSINVSLFPYLSEEKESVEPFAITNFDKDDITWISPTLNQIHQLKNLEENTDTCITIQCYMYDNEDNSHYDYFDYRNKDGIKEPYEPDSDMDFISFKELIRKEWNDIDILEF